jgi:hypothetical protein
MVHVTPRAPVPSVTIVLQDFQKRPRFCPYPPAYSK